MWGANRLTKVALGHNGVCRQSYLSKVSELPFTLFFLAVFTSVLADGSR